ncbi:hypothetical protein RJ035_001731 [Blastomyces gilchristii]
MEDVVVVASPKQIGVKHLQQATNYQGFTTQFFPAPVASAAQRAPPLSTCVHYYIKSPPGGLCNCNGILPRSPLLRPFFSPPPNHHHVSLYPHLVLPTIIPLFTVILAISPSIMPALLPHYTARGLYEKRADIAATSRSDNELEKPDEGGPEIDEGRVHSR